LREARVDNRDKVEKLLLIDFAKYLNHVIVNEKLRFLYLYNMLLQTRHHVKFAQEHFEVVKL